MPHGTARRSPSSSPRSWNLAPQIDLEVSGFEMGEIDVLLDGRGLDQEDELPPIDAGATPVSRVGDLWVLGEHRLLCGDALHAESYARVLGADKAEMMFADPPYNVPVEGHVSGLGAVKHGDFAMASGELSPAEFQSFLTNLARPCGEPVDRRRHPLCLHGLATPAGGACRRRTRSTASSRTCASGTRAMPGWARSIAPSTSSSSCSRWARVRTSTTSRSGAMAGTGPTSGTMSARTH